MYVSCNCCHSVLFYQQEKNKKKYEKEENKIYLKAIDYE